MVLREDKERVRTLLKDTITLLIRNGLTFKFKFSIEALIGVTLDDDDIFLVSINELFKSDAYQEKEIDNLKDVESCTDSSDGSIGDDNSRKLNRKRKKHIKTESEYDIGGESSAPCDVMGGVAVKRQRSSYHSIPGEVTHVEETRQHEGDYDDNDEDDLVFIKEEVDNWAGNTNQNFSFQSQPTDVNFPSLANMNLVPVTPSEMWSPGKRQQSAPYQRQPSTVTSSIAHTKPSQLDPTQFDPTLGEAGSSSQWKRPCPTCGKLIRKVFWDRHINWHQGKYSYSCSVCGKGCSSTTQLRGHMVTHTGHCEYKCDICHKEFRYRTHLYSHVRKAHSQTVL